MREIERNYGLGRGNSYLNNYLSRKSRSARGMKSISKKTAEKLYLQLVASLVICLIVIILSIFDNNLIVSKMLGGVKWVVGTDYDFKTAVYIFRNSVVPGIDNGFKGISNNEGDMLNKDETKSSAVDSKFAMALPLDGKITSNFGVREDPITHETAQHYGIDISGEKGAPIKCALDGVVIKIQESNTLGKSVRIRHSGGIETLYGHCSEILVTENQQVKKGDHIAKVGDTGLVTAPHLHFEVFKDGVQIDPLTLIEGLEELK